MLETLRSFCGDSTNDGCFPTCQVRQHKRKAALGLVAVKLTAWDNDCCWSEESASGAKWRLFRHFHLWWNYRLHTENRKDKITHLFYFSAPKLTVTTCSWTARALNEVQSCLQFTSMWGALNLQAGSLKGETGPTDIDGEPFENSSWKFQSATTFILPALLPNSSEVGMYIIY